MTVYDSDIAVIGMECIFPQAGNVNKFWQNIIDEVDAIDTIPPSRLDPIYYDPGSTRIDRVYCKRGGFIDDYARFAPAKYGIMPVSARYAEPDQLLTLKIAHTILEDLGYFREKKQNFGKMGIILGKGNYIGSGTVKLIDAIRTSEHIRLILEKNLPHASTQDIEKVCEEFQNQCNHAEADNTIGLISNLIVSRVANRFDFHGPAYAIDAACASSLVAIDHAVRELQIERCDTVLAGGVQINHDICFWSVFTQLQAVSRKQQIRPYDRRADGVLIGEGIGIVVLKRLKDAIKHGFPVYAVIKGVGVSSDGKAASPVSPDSKGQIEALDQAWKSSSLDPQDIGYLEGHGTATNAGDNTELASLRDFFGSRRNNGHHPGLGSVKSMIGHAMPAAGVAGIIKTVMALHHQVMPPTIHCEQPNERIQQTQFELVTKAIPWEQTKLPKIAGVNAFGFGGINAHVVLQTYKSHTKKFYKSTQMLANAASVDEEILLLSRMSKESLIESLHTKDFSHQNGPFRIAIFQPTAQKIKKAIKIVDKDIPWRGKQDIWFSNEELIARGGKLAFVFPGIDSSYNPQVNDLVSSFNLPEPGNQQPTNLEETAIAVMELNMYLDTLLKHVGIYPDHIAGHSIGEWSGYFSAKMISKNVLREIIANIDSGFLKVPGVQFLAAGCSAQTAENHLRGLADVTISHDNCPHQTIICGIEKSLAVLKKRFIAHSILSHVLPFQSGFHSHLFQPYIHPFRETCEKIEVSSASTPMWSCTTVKPYPASIGAIKELIIDHLVKPIRFTQVTQKLHNQGVRVFIQVGFGSLTNFIDNTLKDNSHLTIQSNVAKKTGLQQLTRLVLALVVEGAKLDLDKVGIKLKKSPTKNKPLSTGIEMDLQLSVPLIKTMKSSINQTHENIINQSHPQPFSQDEILHPLDQLFHKTFSDITLKQRDILDLYYKTNTSPSLLTTEPKNPLMQQKSENTNTYEEFTIFKELSFDTYPELYDHCLIPQKKGWQEIEDSFPVVPMTMSLEVLMDIASEKAGGQKVIAVESIQALRWLQVTKDPVVIKGRYIHKNRIYLEIKNHFSAYFILSNDYPQAPVIANEELHNPRPSPVSADQFYPDGWMFHGPAYQGISSLNTIGDNGIKGHLTVPQGKGGLLDNAGQLFSFWVAINKSHNRVAIPTQVKKIEFYHENPGKGEQVACTAWIRKIDDTYVSSDIELRKDSSVLTRITEWKDIRFVTDDKFWRLIRNPRNNMLATQLDTSVFIFDNIYYNTVSRENIILRYFNKRERKYRNQVAIKKQAGWISGRIVAKDAVRDLVKQKYRKALYPIEVTIESDMNNNPIVSGEGLNDIVVAIANVNTLAVAQVGKKRKVGIAMKPIENQSTINSNHNFTNQELALLGSVNSDIRMTKFAAAKQAYAQYQDLDINGNLLANQITEIIGENKLVINNTSIKTKIVDQNVIAWII